MSLFAVFVKCKKFVLKDVDFRDFVTLDAQLPKANDTSALSGAGFKRLFRNVGEALNKITIKIDENDRVGWWLDTKCYIYKIYKYDVVSWNAVLSSLA